MLALVITLSGCMGSRMLTLGFSDIRDHKRFPALEVPAGGEVRLLTEAIDPDLGNKRLAIGKRHYRVDSLCEMTKTVAFLVLKGDTLIYERYLRGYAAESVVPSFSMAKSFVSALTGIAIEEGAIGSIDDSVSQYLTEFQGRGMRGLRIRHLLQMTGGLKSSESYYSPFSGAAKMYYGNDLQRQMARIRLKQKPGHYFEYQSASTQLLGMVVRRATGRDLADYLSEKIWRPAGMEVDASWSTDKKGLEKAFCCINGVARDFARFGLLYLNDGRRAGRQVVPEEWVRQSRAIDSNDGAVWYYQRQWWLPSKEGDFMAVGHLGQYIYVDPQTRTVIVRLGQKEGGAPWASVFRAIARN